MGVAYMKLIDGQHGDTQTVKFTPLSLRSSELSAVLMKYKNASYLMISGTRSQKSHCLSLSQSRRARLFPVPHVILFYYYYYFLLVFSFSFSHSKLARSHFRPTQEPDYAVICKSKMVSDAVMLLTVNALESSLSMHLTPNAMPSLALQLLRKLVCSGR